jgi:hypothetical protein
VLTDVDHQGHFDLGEGQDQAPTAPQVDHAQLVEALSSEPVASGIAPFAFQRLDRVGERDLHRSAELASRLPAGRGPDQTEPFRRQRSALEKGSYSPRCICSSDLRTRG